LRQIGGKNRCDEEPLVIGAAPINIAQCGIFDR
jgi:hypothetical protein